MIMEDTAVLEVPEDDDIVQLSVQGVDFSVPRRVLCHVEGSFLSAMFSSRWSSSNRVNERGYVILDGVDPEPFSQVLNLLREVI